MLTTQQRHTSAAVRMLLHACSMRQQKNWFFRENSLYPPLKDNIYINPETPIEPGPSFDRRQGVESRQLTDESQGLEADAVSIIDISDDNDSGK